MLNKGKRNSKEKLNRRNRVDNSSSCLGIRHQSHMKSKGFHPNLHGGDDDLHDGDDGRRDDAHRDDDLHRGDARPLL